MAHNSFVRIPPDSTGKRIRTSDRSDLQVTDFRNIDISVLESSTGETIEGAQSGTTAVITGVRGGDPGVVFVQHRSGTFISGEALTFNDVEFATYLSTIDLTTQENVITDHNNPSNHMRVSHDGSAYVRFLEGNQTFGAFGIAETSTIQNIDEFSFIYDSRPDQFWLQQESGGSEIHEPENSLLRLTTTTTSGSLSARTTNRYYPYLPGQGTSCTFAVAMGDTGKQNVVRRWGMFDEGDGVFFEEDGGDLSTVIRTSIGGTVTERRIHRTEWTDDRLLDSNGSSFDVELDKFGLWWIDFQWLGTGRVRFGTYAPDGTRIVANVMENINVNFTPYMKRGTLPLRVEIQNTGTTASSSEIKVGCMVVQRQCSDKHFYGIEQRYKTELVNLPNEDPVVLFSTRPKQTFNGVTNRTQTIPSRIESFVTGSVVEVEIILNGTLDDPIWDSLNPQSAAEIDTNSTSVTGGFLFNTLFLPIGTDFRRLEETIKKSVQLSADGETQPTLTFVAKKLHNSSPSAELKFLLEWFEAR